MIYNGYFELTGQTGIMFRFLLSALDPKDWRTFAKHIKIDASEKGLTAVATDGRRMHIIEIEQSRADVYGLTEGFYVPVKNTKKMCAFARIADQPEESYPNWKSAIPEEKPEKETQFYTNGLEYMRSIRRLPEWVYLNPQYVADLSVSDLWTCFVYGKHKPVGFFAGNARAYIQTMDDGIV
jgi:hypothetical protein